MTEDNALPIIETCIEKAFIQNLELIPKKTGNLRYRATKLKGSGISYTVLIDEQIAPYAKYVDENGKSKGYWDKFFNGMTTDLIVELNLRQNIKSKPSIGKAPLGGKR